MKATEMIKSKPWAITKDALEKIVEISERKNDFSKYQALLDSGEKTDHEIVESHGDIAVINVIGPIFRYANLFSDVSGATSIEKLSNAVSYAEDNFKKIIFNFDTPGGEATEISSMAEKIKNLKVPTVAYVGAMAASAGYWLASATDKIVISKTGLVGSIGVVATFPKSGDNEVIEIISSQSPNKRIDVETDDGKEKIQTMIDEMADVFVSDVSSYRKVTKEKVLKDFGQGGVIMGEKAVLAGMADELGSIVDLLNENEAYVMTKLTVQERLKKLESSDKELCEFIKNQGFDEGFESASSDIESDKVKAFEEGKESGAASELERIKSVKAQSIPGYESKLEEFMFDGKTTGPQAAVQLVRLMQDKKENVLKAIQETDSPIQDSPLNIDEDEKKFNSDKSLQKDFGTVESYKAYIKGVNSGAIRRFGGA